MANKFTLALALLVAAGAARAEDGSPASKASQCAGDKGPRAGCTGYEARLRRTPEAKASSSSDQPRTPAIRADVLEHLRLPDQGLKKRATKLLISELKQLERLLAVTPKNAPERALMLRRLAEGYAELAAIKAQEGVIAEERARRAD